jgi:hypothetical protein
VHRPGPLFSVLPPPPTCWLGLGGWGRVSLTPSPSAVQASVEGLAGAPDGVGATIGAVVFAAAPANAGEALRAADQRMYEGKRAGRGQVLVGRLPAA